MVYILRVGRGRKPCPDGRSRTSDPLTPRSEQTLSPIPDLLRNSALHGAVCAWLSSALSSSLSSNQPPRSADFPVDRSFAVVPGWAA
jgi:hypothetical protein